jgi:hypothetical protein
MDTTTVLAIIKMIDTRITKYNVEIDKSLDDDDDDTSMYWTLRAGRDALTELQNHLQSYIDGQLNAAENETVE